uniref:Uncharacterized protein n=1 Tax=Trichogramma kaykai TaxID=54128 RepID=A0ABD2VU70_9HYME
MLIVRVPLLALARLRTLPKAINLAQNAITVRSMCLFATSRRCCYTYSESVQCSYACHRTNGELWLRQDSPAESTDCVRECEISMCIRVYLLLLLLLLLLSLQARTSPQSLRAYIDSSLGRHEVL